MEWPKKPFGAAAVITDREGRVLLVKHMYGKLNWELPGGGAEPNESAAETAVREVREETGLVVQAVRMAGCIYYDRQTGMHHFVFVCRPIDGEAVPAVDGVEASECGYWPVDALPRPISDFTVQRIKDALQQSGAEPALVEIGPRQWLE